MTVVAEVGVDQAWNQSQSGYLLWLKVKTLAVLEHLETELVEVTLSSQEDNESSVQILNRVANQAEQSRVLERKRVVEELGKSHYVKWFVNCVKTLKIGFVKGGGGRY
ncbi:hypothetical protein HDV05_000587 [Chytridiales sp. JEL 0842]|nr:hypothetical protein HDV05_000587 [Chytridiales sp. JEL 0842]